MKAILETNGFSKGQSITFDQIIMKHILFVFFVGLSIWAAGQSIPNGKYTGDVIAGDYYLKAMDNRRTISIIVDSGDQGKEFKLLFYNNYEKNKIWKSYDLVLSESPKKQGYSVKTSPERYSFEGTEKYSNAKLSIKYDSETHSIELVSVSEFHTKIFLGPNNPKLLKSESVKEIETEPIAIDDSSPSLKSNSPVNLNKTNSPVQGAYFLYKERIRAKTADLAKDSCSFEIMSSLSDLYNQKFIDYYQWLHKGIGDAVDPVSCEDFIDALINEYTYAELKQENPWIKASQIVITRWASKTALLTLTEDGYILNNEEAKLIFRGHARAFRSVYPSHILPIAEHNNLMTKVCGCSGAESFYSDKTIRLLKGDPVALTGRYQITSDVGVSSIYYGADYLTERTQNDTITVDFNWSEYSIHFRHRCQTVDVNSSDEMNNYPQIYGKREEYGKVYGYRYQGFANGLAPDRLVFLGLDLDNDTVLLSGIDDFHPPIKAKSFSCRYINHGKLKKVNDLTSVKDTAPTRIHDLIKVNTSTSDVVYFNTQSQFNRRMFEDPLYRIFFGMFEADDGSQWNPDQDWNSDFFFQRLMAYFMALNEVHPEYSRSVGSKFEWPFTRPNMNYEYNFLLKRTVFGSSGEYRSILLFVDDDFKRVFRNHPRFSGFSDESDMKVLDYYLNAFKQFFEEHPPNSDVFKQFHGNFLRICNGQDPIRS